MAAIHTPVPRTKKVRVAVVMDSGGKYWAATEDTEIDLQHGEVVNWVEMILPIPDEPERREFTATLKEKADG